MKWLQIMVMTKLMMMIMMMILEIAEVVEIGTGEALTMLDRLVNLKYLSKEERNSLVAMKDKLEKIRVLNKKQSHITDYFKLEESFYDRFY